MDNIASGIVGFFLAICIIGAIGDIVSINDDAGIVTMHYKKHLYYCERQPK